VEIDIGVTNLMKQIEFVVMNVHHLTYEQGSRRCHMFEYFARSPFQPTPTLQKAYYNFSAVSSGYPGQGFPQFGHGVQVDPEVGMVIFTF
jgi:hypothetical protein